MLLYESPVRLPATLKELDAELGDRPAAVLRELTKLHEQAARGTLASLCETFAGPPKGECVIAIAGVTPRETQSEDTDDAALDAALNRLLEEGFSARDAATAVAAVLGVKKKRAYQRTLELGNEE